MDDSPSLSPRRRLGSPLTSPPSSSSGPCIRRQRPSSSPVVVVDSSAQLPPIPGRCAAASKRRQEEDSKSLTDIKSEDDGDNLEPLDFSKKCRRLEELERVATSADACSAGNADLSTLLRLSAVYPFPPPPSFRVPQLAALAGGLHPAQLSPAVQLTPAAIFSCPLPLLGLIMRHAAAFSTAVTSTPVHPPPALTTSLATTIASPSSKRNDGMGDGDIVVSSSSDDAPPIRPDVADRLGQQQYALFRQQVLQQLSHQQPQQSPPIGGSQSSPSNSTHSSSTTTGDQKGLAYMERREGTAAVVHMHLNWSL